MITSEIIKLTGAKPGPTLAIFAGIHGNELAGVYALQKILPTLTISKGTLYVAFANPPAIEANVRMINKNLNRCFYEGNKGKSPEDMRARELMAILDKCDALLDIHMFYDEEDVPFVICEDNAIEIASKFDVSIISTNWTTVEPGATDGYMYSQGKIGICIECGPIAKAKEYTDYAINTIYQFLGHYEMTEIKNTITNKPKKIIKAKKAIYKSANNFILEPGLKDFQKLKQGQIVAKDNLKEYKARDNEYIIFPHYNARVNEEAYIIGEEVSNNI